MCTSLHKKDSVMNYKFTKIDMKDIKLNEEVSDIFKDMNYSVEYEDTYDKYYIVDKNNNKLQVFSIEDISVSDIDFLRSNRNCSDCIDCTYCKNCVECNNCNYCTNCEECTNCKHCTNCIITNSSTNCDECYCCDECVDCSDEKYIY